MRDIDKTSDVLDGATAAGGDLTQVQGISFTIDKPDALQDQAREAAVNDAKARAQRLADTAGVKLGDPISITEGSVSAAGADEGRPPRRRGGGAGSNAHPARRARHRPDSAGRIRHRIAPLYGVL